MDILSQEPKNLKIQAFIHERKEQRKKMQLEIIANYQTMQR
jgi:hypothetical protein